MREEHAKEGKNDLKECIEMDAEDSGRSVADHLRQLAEDGVWGGPDFIRAFVAEYNIRVELTQSVRGRWSSISFGREGDPTVRLFFDSRHFEFLEPADARPATPRSRTPKAR